MHAQEGAAAVMAYFEPRELTSGQLYRLFLERSSREQVELAEWLDLQTAQRQDYPRDTPELYLVDVPQEPVANQRLVQRTKEASWVWKLTRLASDKRALTVPEFALLAEGLGLGRWDFLRWLRTADIYPSEREIATSVSQYREVMEAIPWPAYVFSYRLDRVLAWNRVTGCLYQLGNTSGGPDLPGGYSTLAPEVLAKLGSASLLFDRNGAFRPLVESVSTDEWLAVASQQLAYLASYWAPLWRQGVPLERQGVPQWMKDTLADYARYPEFKTLWNAALASYSPLRDLQVTEHEHPTTRGRFYDRLEFAVAGRHLMLQIQVLEQDPRLELLIQMPMNVQTAQELLALATAAG